MRACVIDAGTSGIAAAKALHQRGFDFDDYLADLPKECRRGAERARAVPA